MGSGNERNPLPPTSPLCLTQDLAILEGMLRSLNEEYPDELSESMFVAYFNHASHEIQALASTFIGYVHYPEPGEPTLEARTDWRSFHKEVKKAGPAIREAGTATRTAPAVLSEEDGARRALDLSSVPGILSSHGSQAAMVALLQGMPQAVQQVFKTTVGWDVQTQTFTRPDRVKKL